MNYTRLQAQLERKFGQARVSRGRNGIELLVVCPVCGKRKLSVNPQNGLYKCWHGCMSGTVSSLLGRRIEIDQDVYAQVQAKKNKVVVPDMPGEIVQLWELDPEHQAVQYLKNRGFDPVHLGKTYGLAYCREGKPYIRGLFNTTNTLVIPVYVEGKLIGWQSRLLYNPDKLDDETCEALGFLYEDGKWKRPPKYFTMPGMDKGKMLFNYDWARQSSVVVVCEGIFDAMAVGRCAVAAFGKGVTDVQANMLRSYWDLVILLLDPGDADDDTMKLAAKLSNAIPVKLRGYKDAGEAPQHEIWRQIDETVTNHPVMAAAGKTLGDYKFIV